MTELRKMASDFHICRRIAIAAAEDNLNAHTMTRAVQLIANRAVTPLVMAGEVLRICSTPNWYAVEDGRRYFYEWRKEHYWQTMKGKSFHQCLGTLEEGICNKDINLAIRGQYFLAGSAGNCNTMEGAIAMISSYFDKDVLSGTIKKFSVYSSNLKVLWKDENYLPQVVWEMISGRDMISNSVVVVTRGQAAEALNHAMTVGYTKVPSYYLDGVHVAGSDPRFGGTIPAMYGMCQAHENYGRLHPEDTWDASYWETGDAFCGDDYCVA
jgi:hypothetical protein